MVEQVLMTNELNTKITMMLVPKKAPRLTNDKEKQDRT
jgi:hypothetical protein